MIRIGTSCNHLQSIAINCNRLQSIAIDCNVFSGYRTMHDSEYVIIIHQTVFDLNSALLHIFWTFVHALFSYNQAVILCQGIA